MKTEYEALLGSTTRTPRIVESDLETFLTPFTPQQLRCLGADIIIDDPSAPRRAPRYMRRAAQRREAAAERFTRGEHRPGSCKGQYSHVLRLRLAELREIGAGRRAEPELSPLHGTLTGRMSSAGPELQNVPLRPGQSIEAIEDRLPENMKRTFGEHVESTEQLAQFGWLYSRLFSTEKMGHDRAMAATLTYADIARQDSHPPMITDAKARKKAIDDLRGRDLIEYDRSARRYRVLGGKP